MLTTTRKAEEGPAEVDGRDEGVVAQRSLREIPACRLQLRSEAARREYDSLARVLFDAGRLSLEVHVHLSMYASMFDAITIGIAAGGTQVRASWYTQMYRALRALRLDDINKPATAPESAPVNKFARVGFAGRLRAPT